MDVFTRKQIDRIFTSKLTQWIQKGYEISTETIGGHHINEICHIDLETQSKPDEIIRIWMTERFRRTYKWNKQVLEISIIEQSLDKESGSFSLESGKTINSTSFFGFIEAGWEDARTFFVSTLDELDGIIDMRKLREASRIDFDDFWFPVVPINKDLISDKLKESILSKLHKIKGFKRGTMDDINSIKIHLSKYTTRICCDVTAIKNGEEIIVCTFN